MAEPPEQRALQSLAAKYSGVTSASAEYRTDPHAASEEERITRATAAENRRFGYEEFLSKESVDGDKWSTVPYYFVFLDGAAVYAARPPGKIYTTVAPDDSWKTGFGAGQLTLAPWACVAGWCQQILDDPNAIYDHSSEVWQASSARTGIVLRWTEQLELLEVRKLLSDQTSFQAVQFSEFVEDGPIPLPRAARQFAHIAQPNGAKESEAKSTLRVTVNPEDAEKRLAFDPVARRLNKLDAATQNLYGPDGAFLFNLKEHERAFDEQLNGNRERRSLMYGAAALAGLLSAFLAFRAIKRRAGKARS